MLNGRAWALRDDLNIPTSSEKFVLIEYVESDNRPAMVAFKVLREKLTAGMQFLYQAEAGKVLQAPMPLPISMMTSFGFDDTKTSRGFMIPSSGTSNLFQ